METWKGSDLDLLISFNPASKSQNTQLIRASKYCKSANCNSNKIKNLEKDVRNFEPKLALDGGLDGTFKILKVIKKASTLLKSNGKLILEIGYDQKIKTIGLLKKRGFYINNVIKDYAKNDRCVISTKIN